MIDSKQDSAAAYRRGSVLGFTIGEIFILLSFILLLILILKQAEVFQKSLALEKSNEQLIEANKKYTLLNKSLETWASFTEIERKDIQELLSTGKFYSASVLAQTLNVMSEEKLADLIQLVQVPGREELLLALKDSPESSVQKLTDAISSVENLDFLASNIGALAGVDPFSITRGITIARSIEENDPRLSNEDFSDILEIGLSVKSKIATDEWAELESFLNDVNWSTDLLKSAYSEFASQDKSYEATVSEQVGAALREEARRTTAVASSLATAIGDIVESRGGKIDARGTISFPDATLFTTGKADLTGEMRSFLDELCTPWLKTLKNQGFEIKEIRIEGHASPGWRGASSEQESYLNNLGLSQSRARVVLEYCINTTWGESLGEWARARSVAIGYSSSRPIVDNGVISSESSQRVMLSAAPDISDIMRNIENSIALPNSTIP
jgi:outer membrane protein OmpA-like peptidoglycan-associated protein